MINNKNLLFIQNHAGSGSVTNLVRALLPKNVVVIDGREPQWARCLRESEDKVVVFSTFDLEQFTFALNLWDEIDVKIICCIRDPRDLIVSRYFSFSHDHFITNDLQDARNRANVIGVDRWCLDAATTLEMEYTSLLQIINERNLSIDWFTYNLLCFDVKRVIQKLSIIFDIVLDDNRLEEIARRNDVKTSVYAGDHKMWKHSRPMPGRARTELSNGVLLELNEKFKDILLLLRNIEEPDLCHIYDPSCLPVDYNIYTVSHRLATVEHQLYRLESVMNNMSGNIVRNTREVLNVSEKNNEGQVNKFSINKLVMGVDTGVSFGWSLKKCDNIIPFDDKNVDLYEGRVCIWRTQLNPDPCIWFNQSNDFIIMGEGMVAPPNVVCLHPGPAGENGVISWRPPVIGRYRLYGLIMGLSFHQLTTTEVTVCFANEIIFQGYLNAHEFENNLPFCVEYDVQTLSDFHIYVGNATDSNSYNSTGLFLEIEKLSD